MTLHKNALWRTSFLAAAGLSSYNPRSFSARSGFRTHRPGQVAQLVEQRTENPCVAGSIPALATTHPPTSICSALLGFGFFRGNEGIKKTHAARGDRSPELFVPGLLLLLNLLDFAPEIFGSAQG